MRMRIRMEMMKSLLALHYEWHQLGLPQVVEG